MNGSGDRLHVTENWGLYDLQATPHPGNAFVGWYGDPNVDGKTDLLIENTPLGAVTAVVAKFTECDDSGDPVLLIEDDFNPDPYDIGNLPAGWMVPTPLPPNYLGTHGVITGQTHDGYYITTSNNTGRWPAIEKRQGHPNTQVTFSYRFTDPGLWGTDLNISVATRLDELTPQNRVFVRFYTDHVEIVNRRAEPEPAPPTTSLTSRPFSHQEDAWYDACIMTIEDAAYVWVKPRDGQPWESEYFQTTPPVVTSGSTGLYLTDPDKCDLFRIFFDNKGYLVPDMMQLRDIQLNAYPCPEEIPTLPGVDYSLEVLTELPVEFGYVGAE